MCSVFECVNKKVFYIPQHFIDVVLDAQTKETLNYNNLYIGTYEFEVEDIIEDLTLPRGCLFRLLRSRWFTIQEVALNNKPVDLVDVVSSREFVNITFKSLITAITSITDDKLQEKRPDLETFCRKLATMIIPTEKLNESVLQKIMLSQQENCIFFNYLHSLLEVYYYLALLYSKCHFEGEEVEELFQKVFKSTLILLKTNNQNKKKCNCLKSFWLIMQILTEKMDSTKSLFWKTFNKIMENEAPIFALQCLYEMSVIQKFNWQCEDLGPRSERIQPNYTILTAKLKELLNNYSHNFIQSSFKLIEPLLCNLWIREQNIDVLQLIWEFYSKKLNTSMKNWENINSLNIINDLDALIERQSHNNSDDFEIFISMLLFHLKEFPLHWTKIKGRIYSQLGPNKVKDLSDVGIGRIVLMFLALSTIHFEEIEKKSLTFLANIPKEKKSTLFVWNIYSAVIIRYVRDGHSIEKLATPVLDMLQEASSNQSQFYLIKDFIKNLELIGTFSMNMQLNQWQVLGPWLERYLAVCYYPDLNHSLNVINLLLEKCIETDSCAFWERFFVNQMYVNLKQLSSSSTPPPIIGKLAGRFALVYHNITNDAFKFFSGETINPNVSSTFLNVILNDYPDGIIITPDQESLVLKSWTKICFITGQPQCELTKNVIKLDCFPPTLKALLATSQDPAVTFIEYFSNTSQNFNIRGDVIKFVTTCLEDLDKSIGHYLSNPEKEEVVMKMYKYTALLFSKCGNLIYNRNKSVTIFTKLVQVLLLPMEFVVGKKSLHPYMLVGIKRHWPTFFEAFISLSGSRDQYLDRTLKDMVVKFLPLFPQTDSPIMDSLISDSKIAETILDKVNVAYLAHPVKENDVNLLKALRMILDIITSTTSLHLFKLIIDKNLMGLFEVIIFHSQRTTAIGVIRNIAKSPLFLQVKPEFKKVVLEVTEKHMALNMTNYFQLMICLAKIVPDIISGVLGSVRTQVAKVERLRGVGFDKSLRLNLERLENSLQNSC